MSRREISITIENSVFAVYVAVLLRRDDARLGRLSDCLLLTMLKELPKCGYWMTSPLLRAQHDGACWLRSRLAPPRRGAFGASFGLSAADDAERAAEVRLLDDVPLLRAQHDGACWLRSRLAPPRRGASVASLGLSAADDAERAAEERLLEDVADVARSTRRNALSTYVAVSLRRDDARLWRLSDCLPLTMLKEVPKCGYWMTSPLFRAQHGGACWLRSRLAPSRRSAVGASFGLSAADDAERGAEERLLDDVAAVARSTRRSVLAT